MGYDGGGGSNPQSPAAMLTTRKSRIPVVTFVTLKKSYVFLPPAKTAIYNLNCSLRGLEERARERAECVEKLKQQQKWAKVQEVPPPGNLVLQGESSYKSLFQ